MRSELVLDTPETLTGHDSLGQLHLRLGDLGVVVGLIGLGGNVRQRVLVVHDALREFTLGGAEGLSGQREGRLIGLRQFDDCVAWHSTVVATCFGFLRLGERPRGETKLSNRAGFAICFSVLFSLRFSCVCAYRRVIEQETKRARYIIKLFIYYYLLLCYYYSVIYYLLIQKNPSYYAGVYCLLFRLA